MSYIFLQLHSYGLITVKNLHINCIVDKVAMMALQQQLLASEKEDDKDRVENGSSAVAGDGSPGIQRVRSRTMTSLSSTKSTQSTKAEKKPLMPNQLIKEEDVEEGAVCFNIYLHRHTGNLHIHCRIIKIPDIFCCNSNICRWILIIFGTNF